MIEFSRSKHYDWELIGFFNLKDYIIPLFYLYQMPEVDIFIMIELYFK